MRDPSIRLVRQLVPVLGRPTCGAPMPASSLGRALKSGATDMWDLQLRFFPNHSPWPISAAAPHPNPNKLHVANPNPNKLHVPRPYAIAYSWGSVLYKLRRHSWAEMWEGHKSLSRETSNSSVSSPRDWAKELRRVTRRVVGFTSGGEGDQRSEFVAWVLDSAA
jgi:hypothetical protein